LSLFLFLVFDYSIFRQFFIYYEVFLYGSLRIWRPYGYAGFWFRVHRYQSLPEQGPKVLFLVAVSINKISRVF